MSHQMKISGINFMKSFNAEKDIIHCNENQVKQAVIAILLNASEAINEGGEVLIKTSNPSPGKIRVEIKDNGVGIAEEDLNHIFEPFFSAKDKSGGTGLGLAIVHGIVQNHNGTVEAESQPGSGTSIILTFPLLKQ